MRRGFTDVYAKVETNVAKVESSIEELVSMIERGLAEHLLNIFGSTGVPGTSGGFVAAVHRSLRLDCFEGVCRDILR